MHIDDCMVAAVAVRDRKKSNSHFRVRIFRFNKSSKAGV